MRSGARLRLKPGERKRVKENDRDERQYRIARLSVASTLIVAVLASATTLVVALVGQSNERQRASEDFTRNQRQIIYTEYINAAIEMRNAHQDFWRAVSQPPLPSDRNLSGSEGDSAYETARLLHSKLPMVQLIGSDETVWHAIRVNNVAARVENSIRHELDFVTLPGQVPIDTTGKIGSNFADLHTVLDELVDQARKDLNS